ncbi:hypothetical protein LCGC14_0607610 [marine sediment metagenome]|uniref:Terminase large subunit gp17-like C-terminal domain-containing protein n=1 Tax=marine sediment metagenome TaxID=412755 RepID=A0A0F9RDE1_9ZZZZ
MLDTRLTSVATQLAGGVELEAEICRRSMYQFVLRSWHLVEPENTFVDNWHIQAICTYLEACYYGDLNQLIINIPPRYMKSMLVNIFFPAWVWTKSPGKKFMCISYAEDVAIRDSIRMRDIVRSEWYQERFGVFIDPSQNEKTKYKNTHKGERNCYGLKGGITGQGGDYILIDDPVKTSESTNEREMERVNQIYDDTIYNRLNDVQTGAKILIMQRLNHNDLAGHLQEIETGWETLILPAEYEVEPRFTSAIGYDDPRTEEGELLWPERFNQDYIDESKDTMSSLSIAGQFQQRPSLLSGYNFKKDWFKERIMNTDIIARFISADTAQATGDDASYSSFAVGELMSDYRLFLRLIHRDKLEFPQLQYEIENLANVYRHKLQKIIVESKSSGISVIQSLRQTSEAWIGAIVVPFQPTTDKVDRAAKAAVWCENESVLLPPASEDFPWLFDFEEELYNFPQGKYKDQVDCFSQLILYVSHYLAAGLTARRTAAAGRAVAQPSKVPAEF